MITRKTVTLGEEYFLFLRGLDSHTKFGIETTKIFGTHVKDLFLHDRKTLRIKSDLKLTEISRQRVYLQKQFPFIILSMNYIQSLSM